MRQQSFVFAMMFAILLTAGTAIVLVSFQLKNQSDVVIASVREPDQAAEQALETPEEEPPLAQVETEPEEALEASIQESPDQIANSSQINGSASSDEAGSSSEQAEIIVDIMVDALPANIDGQVTKDEYVGKALIEELDLEFFWTIPPVSEPDAKREIHFAIRSKYSGCIGILIDPSGSRLKGGDVVLAYLGKNEETDEQQAFIRDDFANEETSHAPDNDLASDSEQESGDHADILTFNASPNSFGGVTLEFSRYLDTGDIRYDKIIEENPAKFTKIQLAISENQDFDCFQAETSSPKLINFFTGEVKDELQA